VAPGTIVRLTARSLRTPLLAALLLVASVGVGEWAARLEAVRARLPAPGIGSPHRQLEVELARLDAFVAEEGRLDCLLVGSSMLYRGVDPRIVNETYRQRTERDIRCFTFGVLGMTASTGGVISEVLARRYRPDLLIYATSLFEGDERGRRVSARFIEDSPWMRYQTGRFTPAGWLADRSQLLRLYLPHRNWMRPDYWSQLATARSVERLTTAAGFGVDPEKVHRAPGAFRDPARTRGCPEAWNYPLSTAALGGLERLAALAEDGQRVALLELPIPPRVFRRCPARKDEHRRVARALARYAQAHGMEAWQPQPVSLVPQRGWQDPVHMNGRGAGVFSRWVGERLATGDAPILARRER
jgi:hypothetical protein